MSPPKSPHLLLLALATPSIVWVYLFSLIGVGKFTSTPMLSLLTVLAIEVAFVPAQVTEQAGRAGRDAGDGKTG